MNSNDIKSLFTINSICQVTLLKQWKNPLNLMSWTALIRQTLHFEYVLKLNQSTAIMKRISVTWYCNALSVTEISCWFNKPVQKLKNIYKNAPRLCHSCYTQTSRVTFSVVVWWVVTLRLSKIFNENHQTEIKTFKATALPNLKVVTLINYLARIEI